MLDGVKLEMASASVEETRAKTFGGEKVASDTLITEVDCDNDDWTVPLPVLARSAGSSGLKL